MVFNFLLALLRLLVDIIKGKTDHNSIIDSCHIGKLYDKCGDISMMINFNCTLSFINGRILIDFTN